MNIYMNTCQRAEMTNKKKKKKEIVIYINERHTCHDDICSEHK